MSAACVRQTSYTSCRVKTAWSAAIGTWTDARTCASAAIDPLGVGCSTKSGIELLQLPDHPDRRRDVPRLVRVESQARVADHRADRRGRLQVVPLAETELEVEHRRAERHRALRVGDELLDRAALQEVEVADRLAVRAAEEVVHGASRLLPHQVPHRHLEPGEQLVREARVVRAPGLELDLEGLLAERVRVERRAAHEVSRPRGAAPRRARARPARSCTRRCRSGPRRPRSRRGSRRSARRRPAPRCRAGAAASGAASREPRGCDRRASRPGLTATRIGDRTPA